MIEIIFFDVGRTLLHRVPTFEERLRGELLSRGLIIADVDWNRILATSQDFWKREREKSSFRVNDKENYNRWVGFLELILGEVYEVAYPTEVGADADRLGSRSNGDIISLLLGEHQSGIFYRLYGDVIPTLEKLKSAGFRLGIISNWDSALPELLERLGISYLFEKIYSSCLLGVEKPSPEIFKAAAAGFDVNLGKCLHVGDDLEIDALPAVELGMSALLVNHSEGTGEGLPSEGREQALPADSSTEQMPAVSQESFREIKGITILPSLSSLTFYLAI